jgi:Ca-activated chloride channel family protein
VTGQNDHARLRAALPWVLLVHVAAVVAALVWAIVADERGHEAVVWRSPYALGLGAGALVVAAISFTLRGRRGATLAFSHVAAVGSRGAWAWLAELPAICRVVALALLAVALARPETFRTIRHEIDSVDIMIVVDMSKSMEDSDMPRDRLDAAQRVIRKFLRRTKNDRVGLVVFGQQAMLQCPLTFDTRLVEQIVSDLAIGDVPELGTAIGDGLALALAQLRRSDATSKVVILLSDGDSNFVTRFEPDDAAQAAKDMGVKVYTLLVGREESDLYGGMSVNPETLRSIARITGGEFFRADNYDAFDRGFQSVRSTLNATKRVITERRPDQQLFVAFAIAALVLLGIELVLSTTRLRRLP